MRTDTRSDNRPATPHPFRWPAILFATTLALMALLFGVLARNGQLIYVWPITGVQLGLLLHLGGLRRNRWQVPLGIAASAGALLLAGIVLHARLPVNLVDALMQAAELALLLAVVSGEVRTFDDLKRRSSVLRLFVAAITVPTLTALTLLSQHATPSGCTSVIMADSLGIVIFVPVVLLAVSGKCLRQLRNLLPKRSGQAAFLLLIGTTAGIFSQVTNPILFLCFPPLILVIFLLGSEGATLGCVAVSLAACTATAHGSGPAWIAQGIGIDHRILLLQLFLWAIVATAFPVGALLAERRAAEAHASESQTIYKTLLQNSDDMIILSRLDGSSRFVSPAVEKVTGWTSDEYAALPPLGGVHPDDRGLAREINDSLADGKANHTFRYRAVHKSGSSCWVEAVIRGYSDMDGGPITGYVATVHDISSLKQIEKSWEEEKYALARENAQLATLAGRDELTGIPNRRTFNRALTMEAARQNRSSDFLSLLMIDVDFFKKYNDCYGHQAGDVCLQKVARVFERSVCRLGDLAARIGGEEFAILLPQTDHAGAAQVAQTVLNGIRCLQLAHQANPAGIVSVSIGIATCLPQQHTEGAQLIQQADRALYESKSSGRNQASAWSGVRSVAGLQQRVRA